MLFRFDLVVLYFTFIRESTLNIIINQNANIFGKLGLIWLVR
jgi:hypothetical protein